LDQKGTLVRTTLACFAAVCLVGVSALALPPAQQPRPASSTTPMNVDEVLKAVRFDLQTSRADIIAKNVVLTSEQAAKFWPVFEKYQKEQGAIMDAQLKGIQKYAEKYETLDDAGALGLMKAHLDRDQKMVTLRQTYLAEFQKVLPARLAVRIIQIDRRVSLAHQIEFSSQIPLVR
jgi:Spy/CpxP family protein refolding chaperone